VGLQLGVGYTIGYGVHQIGTLVLTGTVAKGFLPGLIAVAAFAAILVCLCVRADRKQKSEYALSGRK
jgi:ferrous iron transport protein B